MISYRNNKLSEKVVFVNDAIKNFTHTKYKNTKKKYKFILLYLLFTKKNTTTKACFKKDF